MNPIFNWGAKKSDTVLVSDGDKHDRLRRVLMAPMRPRALESLRDRICAQAQECVVGRGKFETTEFPASPSFQTTTRFTDSMHSPQSFIPVSR
ncbi:hypothetical protein N8077_04405 [Myxococcota bacterium]|nr:hypothetical protein [Myxococcota bacterium]